MTDMKRTETPTVGSKFKKWPPGPRWFLGVVVGDHQVALCLREGTNESVPQALVGTPNAIYVFGEEVTTSEAEEAVYGMFNKTGPSLVDVFQERLESVIVAIRSSHIVPGEH